MSQKVSELAFSFLRIPTRTRKPRNTGITMVLDGFESGYLSLKAADGLMEQAANYIDIVKLVALTPTLLPKDLIRKKIEIYRKYKVEVQTGGMLLERALMKGKLEEYLREFKELGFTLLEVSDSVISLSLEQKVQLVRMIKDYGFKIVAEVGRKFPSTPLSPSATANQINKLLEAGAFKVILESEEMELLLMKGDPKSEEILLNIVSQTNHEDIIFEIPYGKPITELEPVVWWFIHQFGLEVNLGNIEPKHILSVEALRRGLSEEGFGKIVSVKA